MPVPRFVRFIERFGRACVSPRRAVVASDADPSTAAGDAFLLCLIYFMAVRPEALIECFFFLAASETVAGLQNLALALTASFRDPLFFLFFGTAGITLLSFGKRPFWSQFDRACIALVPLLAVHLAGNLAVVLHLGTRKEITPPTNLIGYVAGGLVALVAVYDAHKRPTNTPGPAVHPRRGWLAGSLILAIAAAVLGLHLSHLSEEIHLLQPIARNTPAPAFSLPRIEPKGLPGPPQSLAELRGKVVVVDFWATWCKPCQKSMPTLLAFAKARPDVTVLSINTEPYEMTPYVRNMADQLIPGIPLLTDGDGAAQDAYRATTLPFLVVIDKTGMIRMIHRGVFSQTELANAVDPLL